MNYKEYWQTVSRIGDKAPKKRLIKLISDNIKGSVLDVGCGNGRWARYFDDYLGIDINKLNIEHARKHNPTKKFLLQDIVTYKTDKHFDNILSYIVMGHIHPKYIKKVANKMKKLATKIIMVENYGSKVNNTYCFIHDYKKYFNITKDIKIDDIFHLMEAK